MTTTFEAGHRVVEVHGELDLAIRDNVHEACVVGDDHVVIVDLTDLTFMDCSGYGGLVAARLVLRKAGGSLTLRHQVGQPLQLLTALARLEDPSPAVIPHAASDTVDSLATT